MLLLFNLLDLNRNLYCLFVSFFFGKLRLNSRVISFRQILLFFFSFCLFQCWFRPSSAKYVIGMYDGCALSIYCSATVTMVRLLWLDDFLKIKSHSEYNCSIYIKRDFIFFSRLNCLSAAVYLHDTLFFFYVSDVRFWF